MPVAGLEEYSKDQLIAELIERQTFVGVVIFDRGDAKDGRLEPSETVITKSPPLTRAGVEQLLRIGTSLVPSLFGGTQALPMESPVLRVDEGGTVRIGQSRMTLDVAIEQYENGMTPEDLVRAYDSLSLADAHAVIAYYLRHQDAVRAYLTRRADEARQLRSKVEAERTVPSREELLARRSAREEANAAAGE